MCYLLIKTVVIAVHYLSVSWNFQGRIAESLNRTNDPMSRCLPKDASVLMAVIVTLRFRFPPSEYVQILEAPPAGEMPVKNRPNLRALCSGNNSSPRP